MLAPSSKRPALSPRSAKSPEEVEMYAPVSSTAYRVPPVSSTYSNSNVYRPSHYPSHGPVSTSGAYSNNMYNTPGSQPKPPQNSLNSSSRTGMSQHSMSSSPSNLGYMHQGAQHTAYPQNISTGRLSSTDRGSELVSAELRMFVCFIFSL